MTGIEAWAVICGTVMGTVLATQCAGCAQSPLTPADTALIGAETDEQSDCITQNRGDGGAMDACRAKVRAFYNGVWASKLGDSAVSP